MRYKQQIEQKIQSASTLLDNLIAGLENNSHSKADVMALLANIKKQIQFIEDRLELESQD